MFPRVGRNQLNQLLQYSSVYFISKVAFNFFQVFVWIKELEASDHSFHYSHCCVFIIVLYTRMLFILLELLFKKKRNFRNNVAQNHLTACVSSATDRSEHMNELMWNEFIRILAKMMIPHFGIDRFFLRNISHSLSFIVLIRNVLRGLFLLLRRRNNIPQNQSNQLFLPLPHTFSLNLF